MFLKSSLVLRVPEVRWRVYECLDEFPLDSTVAVLIRSRTTATLKTQRNSPPARLRPDAEA